MTEWYNYQEWNNYRQSYGNMLINGDDIAVPYNTPITALFSGTVVKQYYDASGGVLMIRPDDINQTRGVQNYYYAHLDSTPLAVGAHVQAGQEIGRSGGQLQGGQHPASPQWSTGPHIMLGLSHSTGIPVSSSELTADLNPHWMVDYARGNPVSNIGVSSINGVGINALSAPVTGKCSCPGGYKEIKLSNGSKLCENTVFPFDRKFCTEQGVTDPLTSISQFIGNLSELSKLLANPIRVVKLVFGVVLIGGAIFLIASPQSQFARGISKGARQVGGH